MPADKHLKCFVIMPFGEKADTDGKLINFDVVYRYIIKAAVEELEDTENLEIKCVRCDDIEEAGSIRTDMFECILDADVAVVDITANNPNVFYELGVRHALKECVTVLIGRKLESMPFNIQGLRAIAYDPADVRSFDTAKMEIRKHIVNGLKKRKTDSPIRELLPDLKVTFPTQPLRDGDQYRYKIEDSPDKVLALVTGDIKRLKGVADVWVSSENTHMQMARFHDSSISGTVRYLGAKKDKGQVVDDLIGKALKKSLGWKDEIRTVQPGAVIATESGELSKTHGVKRIFHVASVQGVPGGGYSPVPNIGECVWNALETADEENKDENNKPKQKRLRSILFPILGAGTAKGDVEANLSKMIDTILSYFENNDSDIEETFVMTYDEEALVAASSILDAIVATGRLTGPIEEETVTKSG